MFEFMEDYTMVAVVVGVILVAAAYFYFFRLRKPVENKVEIDMSQDESVSSKDEYVCDGDKCFKQE